MRDPRRVVSLELLTGPANAEKAGAVLDRVRSFTDGGAEPILVVPTSPDAIAYRRELAAGGWIFGFAVMTFDKLREEIAARAGMPAQGAGQVTRQRVAAGVAAAARLDEAAELCSRRAR